MKRFFLLISIIVSYYQIVKVSANVITTEKNQLFTGADIISEDDLRKGVYYENKINITNEDSNINCRNCYYFNNYTIIIGSAIDYDSINNLSYPYVEFYEDNLLMWKKQVKSLGEGYFVSAIIKGDEIVCVGMSSDEYQPKCILYKCDLYGDPLESSFIQSKGVITPKSIFSAGNGYIVVGETTATEGIFSLHKSNNNIIFMIYLDYSLSVINVMLVGNEGNSFIYDVIKFNDKLYFYAHLSGDGFYGFENSDEGYCIIIFDERFEFIDYYEMDYMEGLSSFLIYKDYLYFCNKGYEKTNIDFYKVYLDYIEYEFSHNTLYYLDNNYKMLTSAYEDKLAIFEIINVNGMNYLYVTVYQNNNKIYQYSKTITNNYKLINGKLTDIITLCDVEENIELSEVIYIKLGDDYCLFNNVEIEGLPQDIEEVRYGIYDVFVKYVYNDLTLYVREDYLVKSDINIKNNGIYDLNLEIIANGLYKVNNKEVENNYKIEEEGVYLIELYGPNVSSYYTIEVKKLSDNFEGNEGIVFDLSINENETYDEIDIIQYRNMGSAKEENNDSSGIIITIMLVLSGGFIGVLFPLSHKIKEVVNSD